MVARALHQLGRIGVRLLVVNLLVLLVPLAGLEFARLYERQLLASLERDMNDQAALVRTLVESDLDDGLPLEEPRHLAILERAAVHTRTRIRLLGARGEVVVDSHENGPPEGPESPPPYMLPRRAREVELPALDWRTHRPWPEIPAREEVLSALAGHRAVYTRVRERAPSVFLFVAEPIRHGEEVAGAVYVARSTHPVLVELYRIRSGLARVLGVAILLTALVTAILAWSISRPLGKLSRAAKRVAAGERDVVIPVGGGGEIRELGESFAAMKDRLDARLRYISEFAADVTHEFKSPLTSIRGAAELLDEGAADDPEARRRFLRNIALDVARLDRLVSRLLELSRIEASSELPALVELPGLVRRVAERSATPDQPVEVRFLASSVLVRARETDLETALVNLIDNACRFSPPGSPVVVTVEGGPPAATFCIHVEDRGPGISPAHLPRIFDRFFTTDADRDGTGLGLSIVKSVAEAHGGSVRVATEVGRGARFTVELPSRR